jgi:hypothetical protein
MGFKRFLMELRSIRQPGRGDCSPAILAAPVLVSDASNAALKCCSIQNQFSSNLSERVNPRNALPDDQRVDVVRPLVGLHRFQVHHVAHERVFIRDAVGS